VDCTGEILDKWNEGDSLWVKVKVSSEYLKFIVPKGFISVDGTSLTICDVRDHDSDDQNSDANNMNGWFTFMLISHTQQNVIIPSKGIGDLVNLEVDVLAKMVEKSLIALTDKLERRVSNIESSMRGS